MWIFGLYRGLIRGWPSYLLMLVKTVVLAPQTPKKGDEGKRHFFSGRNRCGLCTNGGLASSRFDFWFLGRSSLIIFDVVKNVTKNPTLNH